MTPPRLLTLGEVAARLSVSRRTASRVAAALAGGGAVVDEHERATLHGPPPIGASCGTVSVGSNPASSGAGDSGR